MYSTALNQKGNHFAIRLFLEKLNAYYFSCLFHFYEIYSSEGQTIKTKLLTQKQSKNLFFSNNVNIIQTQKNEIQGTSCKVNQTRARAHAHTHTHTILSLTFQGSTISTMSFQCHFILNLLFLKI